MFQRVVMRICIYILKYKMVLEVFFQASHMVFNCKINRLSFWKLMLAELANWVLNLIYLISLIACYWFLVLQL